MSGSSDISAVVVVSRLAARIHTRRRFVTLGGWSLLGALAVSLVGVLVVRWTLGASWWWAIPVGASAIGLTLSGLLAERGRWTTAYAAGALDRAHATQSALRTALEIREQDGDEELVAAARRRGSEVASRVEPSSASRPARPAGWWWTPPVTAGVVVAGLYAQPIRRDQAQVDPTPMVQRALDQIEVASADAGRVDPATLPDPDAWREAFAEVEALEEALRSGNGDPDAPARAAAALEQAADELDRQAEQDALEQQRLRESAGEFEATDSVHGSDEVSGLAERLADALARNDMLEAEEAARAIDAAERSMSDAERRALADTLEDLADRLEPDTAQAEPPTSDVGELPPPPDTTSAERSVDQVPQDQAGTDPSAPREASRNPGSDPDSLPGSLRDQAESLRNEPQREPNQPTGPESEGSSSNPSPDDSTPPGAETREGRSRESNESAADESRNTTEQPDQTRNQSGEQNDGANPGPRQPTGER
ncbi:MAG: hypothetical protein AAGA55_09970, partial [Planctomycetota bacterium]